MGNESISFGICHHQVPSRKLCCCSTSLVDSHRVWRHLLVKYILNLLLADAEKRKGEARLQGVRSHSAGLLGKSRMYRAARPRMRGLTCQRSGSLLERRTAARRTDRRTNNAHGRINTRRMSSPEQGQANPLTNYVPPPCTHSGERNHNKT